jgi:hypothetical protein
MTSCSVAPPGDSRLRVELRRGGKMIMGLWFLRSGRKGVQ